MATAAIKLQVATLSDVPDDRTREDGVPNQVVTVTAVGLGGTEFELRFWAVSPNTAVPTLTLVTTGDYAYRQWTFNPGSSGGTGSGYGKSFGLELIVNGSSRNPVKRRRRYSIPTQIRGLVFPLHGEDADPTASIQNQGTSVVRDSLGNAGGNPYGYTPNLQAAIAAIETNAAAIAAGAAGAVPTSRLITTTAPLRIGGGASADLSADRTLSINAATTGAPGTMSAADKQKLDDVPTPATLLTTGYALAGDVTGTPAATVITKRSSAWTRVATGQASGTANPKVFADAVFTGLSAGGSVAGNGAAGLVAASLGDAGALTLSGLGANDPLTDSGFAGQRSIYSQLRKIDGDQPLLIEMLSSATGEDRNAPVYGYLSRSVYQASDQQWRFYFYYRRAADGVEVAFTPDSSIANCALWAPQVFTGTNMPVSAGLGFGNVGGQAAPSIGAKSIGTAELDDAAVTDAKVAATLKRPFGDNIVLLQNAADPTKQAWFDLASIGAGQLRQFTLPNSDVTMVASELYQVMRWSGSGWAPDAEQLPATYTNSAGYSVLDTDRLVFSDAGGPATVTLPASPRDGHRVVIFDAGGVAAANNITINGNGTNINGSATKVINKNKAAVALAYRTGFWHIEGEYGMAGGGWTYYDLSGLGGGFSHGTDDSIISSDSTAGPYSASLVASPRTGQLVYFFDRGNNASVNNQTLSGNGNNINGAASYKLTGNRQSVLICYGGSEWNVISEGGGTTLGKFPINAANAGDTLRDFDQIVRIPSPGGTNITITMPSNPAAGRIIGFVDDGAGLGTYKLTVAGNGFNINGSANYDIASARRSVFFGFFNNVWQVLYEFTGKGDFDPTIAAAGGTITVTRYQRWVPCQTSGGAVTVNLPTSPVDGEIHTVVDSDGSGGSNNITVQGATNINGAATHVINTNRGKATYTYFSNAGEWKVTA